MKLHAMSGGDEMWRKLYTCRTFGHTIGGPATRTLASDTNSESMEQPSESFNFDLLSRSSDLESSSIHLEPLL